MFLRIRLAKLPRIITGKNINVTTLHIYYLAIDMRFRTFILKCTAVFLMALFAQKSGAGLFLHSILHTGSLNEDAPDTDDTRTINYTCTCIDNFLMPFDEAGELRLTHSLPAVFITPIFFETDLFYNTSLFSPLRGPPSV